MSRVSEPSGVAVRRAAGAVAAALVVAGSALIGWRVAGAPPDGAGTVPPSCPVALAADRLTTGRGGVADRLVPVPLPQPRGPVAVRICVYPSGRPGVAPVRQVTLDPPRTAELAGVLNTPPSPPSLPTSPAAATAAAARPADCPPGGPVTLLLFRYTQGKPLVAELDAGACALVSTSARVERGRTDVVDLVARALP